MLFIVILLKYEPHNKDTAINQNNQIFAKNYMSIKPISAPKPLTSVRLPFPGFLPEIQMRQPRKEGIREALFLCPHL